MHAKDIRQKNIDELKKDLADKKKELENTWAMCIKAKKKTYRNLSF